MVQLGTFGDAVFVAHDLLLSVAVIGARLVADYCGTWTGVRLGVRLDRRKPAPPVGIRLDLTGSDPAMREWLKKSLRIRKPGEPE